MIKAKKLTDVYRVVQGLPSFCDGGFVYTDRAYADKIERASRAAGCMEAYVERLPLATPEQIAASTLQPVDAWHDDDGAVLWWYPGEPPHCGTPLDEDWPGDDYGFVGWTPLLIPQGYIDAARAADEVHDG